MTTNGKAHVHIPEPVSRPGDAPAFGDLRFPAAGETRRPAIDETARDMKDVAEGLVRVLDEEGRATGPWSPLLEPEKLIAGLRHMLTVRALDRKLLVAQRQGKSSFYMQCTGEEAVSCGFRMAMRPGDMAFPTYRQQGLLVAAEYPLELMMAQVFSNDLDPMHGRQLPVFYSSKEHGFFSISGNLATQYIQGVGWAMASAFKGEDTVTSAWVGEGASAEGDVYAGLLFASSYSAPIVLNVVNNQWAISTFQGIPRGSSATFAERGAAFGLPALRVDGNDYLAVYAAASWAIQRAREGLGPSFIEWVTYRVAAHSTSDDPAGYRPAEEAAAWPLGDPVDRLRQHLLVAGILTEDELTALNQEAERLVEEAAVIAESHGTLANGGKPSPRLIFEDVYAVMPEHLRRQRQEAGF